VKFAATATFISAACVQIDANRIDPKMKVLIVLIFIGNLPF
jgi:hypothetical protein